MHFAGAGVVGIASFIPLLMLKTIRGALDLPYYIRNSNFGKNYIGDPIGDQRIGSSYLTPNMVKKIAKRSIKR